MANRDHYAEFLATECKDIETPSWLLIERAFEAGRSSGQAILDNMAEENPAPNG